MTSQKVARKTIEQKQMVYSKTRSGCITLLTKDRDIMISGKVQHALQRITATTARRIVPAAEAVGTNNKAVYVNIHTEVERLDEDERKMGLDAVTQDVSDSEFDELKLYRFHSIKFAITWNGTFHERVSAMLENGIKVLEDATNDYMQTILKDGTWRITITSVSDSPPLTTAIDEWHKDPVGMKERNRLFYLTGFTKAQRDAMTPEALESLLRGCGEI